MDSKRHTIFSDISQIFKKIETLAETKHPTRLIGSWDAVSAPGTPMVRRISSLHPTQHVGGSLNSLNPNSNPNSNPNPNYNVSLFPNDLSVYPIVTTIITAILLLVHRWNIKKVSSPGYSPRFSVKSSLFIICIFLLGFSVRMDDRRPCNQAPRRKFFPRFYFFCLRSAKQKRQVLTRIENILWAEFPQPTTFKEGRDAGERLLGRIIVGTVSLVLRGAFPLGRHLSPSLPAISFFWGPLDLWTSTWNLRGGPVVDLFSGSTRVLNLY